MAVGKLASVDPSIVPHYIPEHGTTPGGFRMPYNLRGVDRLRSSGSRLRSTGGSLRTGSSLRSTGNSLPTVTNPDHVYANLTRQDYLDYKRDFGAFEERLIEDAQNDTSLIDQAREDSKAASGIAEGVARRNASRYGATLTPAQLKEQERVLTRGKVLGTSQALSDARIAQKELNTQKLADLINIGQGINRTSLSQLGSAAADATNRNNAYRNAKASSRAQTYSNLGSLGAAAIFAFAF